MHVRATKLAELAGKVVGPLKRISKRRGFHRKGKGLTKKGKRALAIAGVGTAAGAGGGIAAHRRRGR